MTLVIGGKGEKEKKYGMREKKQAHAVGEEKESGVQNVFERRKKG